MLDSIITTMARNQSMDQPVLLTYALIGNDVCNGYHAFKSSADSRHHDIEHMTTPQEFYTNVVGAMKYLDGVLPAGSRVYFVGLVDGRILYDTMSERFVCFIVLLIKEYIQLVLHLIMCVIRTSMTI
jgi:acyloxyacyl hydrolase